MATLLEILNKSTDFLTQKGICDARFEAEMLISFGLGIQRLEIYLQFDRPLAEDEIVRLRELIAQRGKRIPLQHLLGQVGFRHIELKTDSRALIPRPDTECIVDVAHEQLKTRLESDSLSILEIGVGTGAILLSIAHEWSNAQCTGVDISPQALELSKENAQLNQIEKINWLESDLFENVLGKFDLIISNPPYIPSSDLAHLEPEVSTHDPQIALDGGRDGFDVIRRILLECETFLKQDGFVILEVGYDQWKVLPSLECGGGLQWIGHGQDFNGIPRFGIWKNNEQNVK